jgi:hypothetical protein
VDDSTKELKLGNHAHKLKSTDENATEFTKTTATLYDSMPAGSYVLTADVTLTKTWEPQNDIILDLNGYSITYSSQTRGSVIKVTNKLTIYDCNSTNKTHYFSVNEETGLWTLDEEKGSQSVTGGVITGGTGDTTSANGGGVYVAGTFTMYGGNIVGNTTGTYNNGGGVFLLSGTFTMTGGSITGNRAYNGGGGVYAFDGTFTMTGGSITGNSAGTGGGVYPISSSTFKVSGTPNITGNTGGNVYLSSGKKITIDGALTEGASIGVGLYGWYIISMGNYQIGPITGTFTQNWSTSGSTSTSVFFSDNATEYEVAAVAHNDGENYELELKAHTHTTSGVCSCGVHVHKLDESDEKTEAVTFTPWTSATALPDVKGNYYLTKDVTISTTWQPKDGTVLDLNGYTITYSNSSNNGSVIEMRNSATFTLYDCKNGTGSDGKITGGTNSGYGGGVYMHTGTFNMYGGNICDNTAGIGGGVCLYGGTFNMYGGSITGNTASTGGGVFVLGGTFNVKGSPTITGNTGGNVYLNMYNKIKVTGDLTGASIGVTKSIADPFTSGWHDNHGNATKSVFFADVTGYGVNLVDGELALHEHKWSDWSVTRLATCAAAGSETQTCSVCGDENTQSIPQLAHSYTYTADGAEITETCSNGCGHSATATITAPSDTTYTGKAIEATVNYSADWVGQKPEIDYGDHDNVDPGKVTASITVGEATASVTYTIRRILIPYTAPAKDKDTAADTDQDDDVLRVDIPAEAVERGETVILSQSLAAGDTVEITTPGEVTVEIPVENVSATTVAVLVSDDGTEKILKTAKLTDDGLLVTISGDATVQIKDNKKKFIDVADGYWGETAIYFNAAREIFNGTSSNTFSPENDTTRQMLMTVLARLSGVNTGSGYDIGMAWAVENEISDGSNPTDPITREQLATMLWRYVGSPDSGLETLDFVDADQISAYAEEAVRWAVETGILAGKGNGILDPKGNASRAQVAQMMMNFINKY